jgi:hypothetical protein
MTEVGCLKYKCLLCKFCVFFMYVYVCFYVFGKAAYSIQYPVSVFKPGTVLFPRRVVALHSPCNRLVALLHHSSPKRVFP